MRTGYIAELIYKIARSGRGCLIQALGAVLLLLSINCLPVCGQEVRALITGTILDPSGGAVSGASIRISNIDTNLAARTSSGSDGTYVIPQLPIGNYDLTVEAPGFKTYTRQRITLNVGVKARVDVSMQLGVNTETVSVSAELTGIESNQSVVGQVLNNRQITEIPAPGRNFTNLMQLNAGVLGWEAIYGGTLPTDGTAWENGRGIAFVMHGGRQNSNSFSVDGAPLGNQGGASFIPLEDAIQEMKVSTPTSDASNGLSGGGVVSISMKPGTNQLHGTFSEFFRNDKLNAWQTQAKLAAAQNPVLNYSKTRYNVFSGMLSGAVIKDHLFYTAYYSGQRFLTGMPVNATIPTVPQRTGDFSQTVNSQRQQIVIYDPLTTQQAGTAFTRDPFPGNKLPASRINPISANIMTLVPLPNYVLNPITNVNNFAATNNVSSKATNDYYGKVDYLWNDKNRTSATVTMSWGTLYAQSQNGVQRPNPLFSGGQDPAHRDHKGTILDHVYTINPTTVLNVRVAWDFWVESNLQMTDLTYDASKLGYKGATGSDGGIYFAPIAFTNYTQWGANQFINQQLPKDNYLAVADLSKSLHRHLLRAGLRLAQIRDSYSVRGQFTGFFNFNPAFTQRNPQQADTTSGSDMASFLLGYPASGGADNNTLFNYRMDQIGLYIQDDFKVTPKLTLNFGLRWDIQTPPSERYNRMNIGFDPAASYQLGGSTAKGGILFANDKNRTPFDTHWRDFQPRFGMAYQLSHKLIWRAGYGISYLPMDAASSGTSSEDGGLRAGYSVQTPYVATVGGGVNSYIPNLPGASTFAVPFPNGFLQPAGAAAGAATGVGTSISLRDRGYQIPYVQQFNAGFGYELPWHATVEASYVGSRTHHIAISQNLNYVPLDQRLLGVANPSYLNAAVPNPFYGATQLQGTSLASATITRSQSLLPFPQFTGTTLSAVPLGNSSYNALEMRASKRYSQGLTMTLVYAFAKAMEATSYLEPQYQTLDHELSSWDRTHNLTVYASYELPVGKGKLLGNQWGPVLNRALGNWQYNIEVIYMNGTPLAMPGAIPARDPRLRGSAQSLSRYFDTCTLLTSGARANCSSTDAPITWVQLLPNQLRTFSLRFPNIRTSMVPATNMSLFKIIPIKERMRLELRAQAYNAMNNRQLPAPITTLTSTSFGAIVGGSQANGARSMELALRLLF